MRRGVLPVVGSLITQAQRPECRLRPILLEPSIRTFDRRVRGQEITDIGRRGKRVMIHLGNQDVIVIEPRMT
ncbi:MAG: DNA-formamidopyrimidine glycosylase family protein, partial [Rubripirellula sp.]